MVLEIGVCVFAHMDNEDHRGSPDIAGVLGAEGQPKTSKAASSAAVKEIATTRVMVIPVKTKYYEAQSMFWFFNNFAQLNSWLDEKQPSLSWMLPKKSKEEKDLKSCILIFVARIDLKDVDDELMSNLQRATSHCIAEVEVVLLKGSSTQYEDKFKRLETFCREKYIEIIETSPSMATKQALSASNESYGLIRFREVLYAIDWPRRSLKKNPTAAAEHAKTLKGAIDELNKKEGARDAGQSTNSSDGKGDDDPNKAEKATAQLDSYLDWPPSAETEGEILQVFGDILNDEEIFGSGRAAEHSASSSQNLHLSAELTSRLERTAREARISSGGMLMSSANFAAQLESLARSAEMRKTLEKKGLAKNIITGKPLKEMKEQSSQLEGEQRVAFAENISRSMMKKLDSSTSVENLDSQEAKDDDKKESAKSGDGGIKGAVAKGESSKKKKTQ